MFCVGDHLVQAVLPFVLPIFGKIDNNNNNNSIFIHKNRSRNFDTGRVLCHISVVFIPIPFKPQKGTPTMVAPST